MAAEFARRGLSRAARSHRADREHQRSLCAALQAALRCGRRGAGATAELSALRASHRARIGRGACRTASSTTAPGASISIDRVARQSTSAREPCSSCRRTIRRARFLHADDLRRWRESVRSRGHGADRRRSVRRLSHSIRAPHAASVLRSRRDRDLQSRRLSKSSGLPQVKLGWIGFGGPAAGAATACSPRTRCRRHVSVGVDAGAGGAAVAARSRRGRPRADSGAPGRNLAALRAAAARCPSVTRADVRGRLVGRPAGARPIAARKTLVLELLTEDHVLVHPGFFFDFAREAFVVVSLLVEPGAVRSRHRPAAGARLAGWGRRS